MAETPDAEIIDDIVEVLKALEVNGKSLASVIVTDSPESFVRVTDTFKGPAAGVVAGRAQRSRATDNAEAYVARLDIPIVVRVPEIIGPSGDVQHIIAEVNDWVEEIREAVMVDQWRGGKASLIVWSGKTISGTNVDGEPRWVRHRPGDGVLAQIIPVVVGYAKYVDE